MESRRKIVLKFLSLVYVYAIEELLYYYKNVIKASDVCDTDKILLYI